MTLIGVTYLEPLMVAMVTWLSSSCVMMSSAPAMMLKSRPLCGTSLKSVTRHKSITSNMERKLLKVNVMYDILYHFVSDI